MACHLLIGLYAAAVAVPLLLLLYFLKLKRREVVVSSTLLWKRAVQDLQVNAPFQRLRRNLLLLLQLLALAAILVALAGPVLAWKRGPGQRYVLLIDRSASMNATDVTPSRLDAAKEQAKVFIESMRSGSALSLRDGSDHAMVIAFDQHAKVMCNFTSDKRQLTGRHRRDRAERRLVPAGEGVTVARAFAQSPGVRGQHPQRGDGRQAGPVQRRPHPGPGRRCGRARRAGLPPDRRSRRTTSAITAMNARRSYEQPEQVEVFAVAGELRGRAGDAGRAVGHRRQRACGSVRHDPACQAARPARCRSSRARRPSTSRSSHSEGGVLEVRQLGADALACDDAAWSILEPPKRLSVLLVTQGNPVLESALQACPWRGWTRARRPGSTRWTRPPSPPGSGTT